MYAIAEFRPTLASLSPTVQRLLFSKYGDGDPVSPPVAMILWTADLISRVQLVDADQRNLLIDHFAESLQRLGGMVHLAISEQQPTLPVAKLGLADRRYVFMSGQTGFLDLTTGEAITGLSQIPLEEIYYNLSSLFARQHLAAQPNSLDPAIASGSPAMGRSE